jgi:hypothetical protein
MLRTGERAIQQRYVDVKQAPERSRYTVSMTSVTDSENH